MNLIPVVCAVFGVGDGQVAGQAQDSSPGKVIDLVEEQRFKSRKLDK
jgi:hypothetical protein